MHVIRTAVAPVTNPSIWTPASAKAALAAVAPMAAHPNMEVSESRTVICTSIDDFGRRSNRMAGRRAC